MSPDNRIEYEPATPDYVLAVLRESVRLQTRYEILEADWPAADLVGIYNDLTWPTTRLLAEFMNSTFDVQIPVEDWLRAFPKLRGRSVGDVCEFLAPRVRRPTYLPWQFIGGECRPAGAFLAVQEMLAISEGTPELITPSSRPDSLPYADLFRLFWRLNLISPGRITPPREKGSLVGHHLVGILGTLWLLLGSSLGFVLTVLGLSTGSLVVAAIGLAMLATGIACGWVVNRVQKPPYVRANWQEYPTFCDLAYCLAGQEPRRRIQPTP